MPKKYNYPIAEIFYSLQGEGRWTGKPAVFVRVAGCSLRPPCEFCDTDHSVQERLPAEDIATAVMGELLNHLPLDDIEAASEEAPLKGSTVVVTGGEPTDYKLGPLLKALRRHGIESIHLETNGTNIIPEGFDWVTVSPKRPYDPKSFVAIGQPDEWKFLLAGAEFLVPVEPYLMHGPERGYIQPLAGSVLAKKKAISLCLSHPDIFMLSTQVHKLLGLR